jgi:hypothetical protein
MTMKNTATLASYYNRHPMEMTVRCPELPRKNAFVKIIELVGFRPRLYAGHVVPGEYQFWSAHEGEFEAAENIVKLAGAYFLADGFESTFQA